MPPGQRSIAWFPRFGKDLAGTAPEVPEHPLLTIRGAVTESFDINVASLVDHPRCELVADFHCVTGWTVKNLHWEGIPFRDFYRRNIEPALAAGSTVTHLQFRGLDGQRSVVQIEDALAGDVLLADTLDGLALDGDHGAPIRIVSPSQYGYVSIKHLCAIDVLTASPIRRAKMPLIERLIEPHPRARVWAEERHGSAPSWLIRPIYRAVKWVLLARIQRRAT